nr:hypothetical protein [uncultured Catonella sp.]
MAERCCYDCEFCRNKNTKFPYCDLTINDIHVSMVLGDIKTEKQNWCPLEERKFITVKSYRKHEAALRKRGIKFEV